MPSTPPKKRPARPPVIPDTVQNLVPPEMLPAKKGRRYGIGIPYELFIALAVYALACLGYVWKTYWTSPDYQAAEHYQAANELLAATKDGHSATHEQLVETYRHLLEVARLKPEIRNVHDQLESLNWRFDDRHEKVPEDLRHSAEAVATIWLRIQKENEPILVVGVRDRGWAPDQVLEGPERVAKWSPVGGLLIIALWAWWRFGAMRGAQDKNEEKLQALERDVRDIEGERVRVTQQRPAKKR